MGVMNTIRAGGVLASELNIPAYAKRNAFKLAGLGASAGVGAYSANNARRNGLNAGNSLGMAAGIAGGVASARGLGIRSAMTMAGRKGIASNLRKTTEGLAKVASSMEVPSGMPLGPKTFQGHSEIANKAYGMSSRMLGAANSASKVNGPRTIMNRTKMHFGAFSQAFNS